MQVQLILGIACVQGDLQLEGDAAEVLALGVGEQGTWSTSEHFCGCAGGGVRRDLPALLAVKPDVLASGASAAATATQAPSGAASA
jgi:hypothetical protein